MAIHLAASGLEKGYRKGKNEVPVLRGVDLEVERGEFVAVVGASGSGKSTLLHVLGLLDTPDEGSVWLDGQRIDNLPDRQRDALRNRTFGFIFQFYHLLPELTALENVMMPAADPPRRPGLLADAQDGPRRGRGDLLERVGLGHRLDHRPSELSGGEMQRAAIARALAGGPPSPPGRRADRQPRRRDRPGGPGTAPRLEPRARAHYDDGHARPPDRPASRPGRSAGRGADRGMGPRPGLTESGRRVGGLRRRRRAAGVPLG